MLPGIWLFRWLVLRLEFGAGLIKLRGDPCWRDLTCLDYHYETQPMPNPLSWYFHRAPRLDHRRAWCSIIRPSWWCLRLFLPQPVASIAGVITIAFQTLADGQRQFLLAQLR